MSNFTRLLAAAFFLTSVAFPTAAADICARDDVLAASIDGAADILYKNCSTRISSNTTIDELREFMHAAPVGINTTSPSTTLHVRADDGTAQLLVEEANAGASFRTLLTLENNGGLRFSISDANSGFAWNYEIASSGTVLRFDNTDDAADEMVLNNDGDLTILGNITTGGLIAFCSPPVSAVACTPNAECADDDFKYHCNAAGTAYSRVAISTW